MDQADVLSKLWEAIIRVEGKLDALLLMRGNGTEVAPGAAQTASVHVAAVDVFRRFTTKQHATLQCLMDGWSNERIAKVLDVTINTVKVHVRAIAKKLSVQTRVQITLKLQRPWELVSAEDYGRMSGGLPKDWATQWAERRDDPYAKLVKGE